MPHPISISFWPVTPLQTYKLVCIFVPYSIIMTVVQRKKMISEHALASYDIAQSRMVHSGTIGNVKL